MTDSIQRELGEISATLRGISQALDDIKETHKNHGARIGSLETARNILYGAIMAVGVIFMGVYHAVQTQIEQVTTRMLH